MNHAYPTLAEAMTLPEVILTEDLLLGFKVIANTRTCRILTHDDLP